MPLLLARRSGLAPGCEDPGPQNRTLTDVCQQAEQSESPHLAAAVRMHNVIRLIAHSPGVVTTLKGALFYANLFYASRHPL